MRRAVRFEPADAVAGDPVAGLPGHPASGHPQSPAAEPSAAESSAAQPPVTGLPVTKLGGLPVWLEEPQWPLSASVGEPMTFLGQFRLDTGGEPRLAYVFMTDADDYVDGTWEPEGGENAVIVQPGGKVPPFVTVRGSHAGPSWPTADHLPVEVRADADGEPWQFLGGDPNWLQGDETPGEGWRFVGQLTDDQGYNFGDAGIAYVFISPDGDEGRFLWQCG